MLNTTRIRYLLWLCAVGVLVFDLGGLTAEAINGSAPPFEVGRTPVGAPYVLFEGASGDHPVWDCSQPIAIAVNLRSVPMSQHQALIEDIATAIKDINNHSLFGLFMVGQTSVVPGTQWAEEWDHYSPAARVVISFGDATDTDIFEPGAGAAAMGGLFARRNETGDLRAFAGFVYVHTAHLGDYKKGSGYLSRVALFTHELLHVLGLGHVHPSHAHSILTPRLTDSYGQLGLGDQSGLRRLAEIGCPDLLL